jgi:hypothetical protein
VLPPDITQNGQPPVADQNPLQGLEDIADAIGNAVRVNAKKSAGSEDPDGAEKFARAALHMTQSLDALNAMLNPQAPNAKGDNPAKRND